MQTEAGALAVTRPYCTLSSSVVNPVPLGSFREGSACASEAVLSFTGADSMGPSLSFRGDQDMLVYPPMGDHEPLQGASELRSILSSSPQDGGGEGVNSRTRGWTDERRMGGRMGGCMDGCMI